MHMAGVVKLPMAHFGASNIANVWKFWRDFHYDSALFGLVIY